MEPKLLQGSERRNDEVQGAGTLQHHGHGATATFTHIYVCSHKTKKLSQMNTEEANTWQDGRDREKRGLVT
jgi:hypothetical protein